MNSSENTMLPRNLTGQIVVDSLKPVFKGNYSYVYRAILEGQLVAVKVIEAAAGQLSRRIRRERTIWASLNHPNIHQFYGFAEIAEFGPFEALISPWCNNGDAHRYLNEHGAFMSESDRIELWKGVIDAVAYLHLHVPMIIHGDLKPGNVLIDALGQPRICDFGLARIFLDEEDTGFTTTAEHTGTERYLAPELVMSETTVYPTTQSDVWALGCLGLEFIYLQKPYSRRINNMRGIIISDVKKGVPPASNPPQPTPHIWDIIKKCWHRDPERRPLALTVARLTKARILEIASKNGGDLLGNHDSVQAGAVMSVMQETEDPRLEETTLSQYNLGDRLSMTNEVMPEGYYLQSQNGQYRLICQEDGNVVLYGPGNHIRWTSSTTGTGKPPYRIVAQSDRDLVVYDSETALWKSETYWPDHPGTFIVVQNDGNLVMYQVGGAAVWTTNTPGDPAYFTDQAGKATVLHSNTPEYSTIFKHSLGDRLTMTDEVIQEGYYLQSQNGRYRFVCREDGNMVLYGPENDVMWMSSTAGMGKPPYRIIAQSDRDFVLYDRERALWKSDTYWPGHPGTFIVLQNDGNLVMYEVGGAAVWDRHTGGHS